MDNEKLKLVEDYIKSQRAIKFSDLENYKFSTVHDLIKKSCIYSSVYVDTSSFYSASHIRRSVSDLYLLAIHYGFDKSLEDFYHLLADEIRSGGISSWYCKEIKKRVYLDSTAKFFNGEYKDEYGIDLEYIFKDIPEGEFEYGKGYVIKEFISYLSN